MRVFLDSNVPMYVAGRAHACRAPSLRFLERVRAGEVALVTSTEVLQEILFRYTGLQRLDLAAEVYDAVVDLCEEVLDVTLAATDRARDLLVAHPSLSARDAVHAGVMLTHGIQRIATFDAGFDAMPDVERIELP